MRGRVKEEGREKGKKRVKFTDRREKKV
jgi:hypothetical protein